MADGVTVNVSLPSCPYTDTDAVLVKNTGSRPATVTVEVAPLTAMASPACVPYTDSRESLPAPELMVNPPTAALTLVTLTVRLRPSSVTVPAAAPVGV